MLCAAVNNARIPLECIADVTHVASGRTQRIAMGASCKTEACFVPEDIWRGAAEGLSADFVPIGSLDSDAWLVVKSYDTVGKSVPISDGPEKGQPQPDRQTMGSPAEPVTSGSTCKVELRFMQQQPNPHFSDGSF